MRTGSYVGRISKSVTSNPAVAQPVFTISLPNYACEVRFKLEGSSKNTWGYSWNPKYNTDTVIPNDIATDTDWFSIQGAGSGVYGAGGIQTTKEYIWRHADGMPNALFIIPVGTGVNEDTVLSYSILGGKNNGY